LNRPRRAQAALALLLAGCAAPLAEPLPRDPGEGADPVLRLATARALSERGFSRAAIDLVDAVLASRPDDPDGLREKARLHEEISEERAALAALDRLLARNPGDLDALYRAGAARARIGEFDEAIALLERYAREVPNDPGGRRALGFALYGRASGTRSEQDLARAEEEYRAARALAPGIADLHHDLASLLAERGASAEAETEYRAALACDPEDLSSLEGLVDLLAKEKRWEEAAPLAQAALERERDPRRKDRLAKILEASGSPIAPKETGEDAKPK